MWSFSHLRSFLRLQSAALAEAVVAVVCVADAVIAVASVVVVIVCITLQLLLRGR